MSSTTLEYVGVSGWALVALTLLWQIGTRFVRSKCMRGDDGNLHFDISLNTSEISAIAEDATLKRMFQELKDEITRRHQSQPTVDSPTRSSARVVPAPASTGEAKINV